MKKLLPVFAIIVVIVAVASVVYVRLNTSRAPATASVATAQVQMGTLSATINSAGNVTAHQAADLTFGQSGIVSKINVKVGDRVKAGDVLAELDTANLNLQLRNAQVSLKIAQDKLAQTQNPTTQQDIASARARLDSAQAAYDKLAAGPSQSDLASAQASLASAQASYDAEIKSAGTNNSQLVSAAASYEKARIALQQAQSAYDKVAWRADVGMSSQAQDLQSATIDYNSAKANYDALVATAQSSAASSLAQAQAQLQSAQSNLDKLKDQVTPADLASAQATLVQAKNDLDTLLAGPDANTLDIAQNGVEQAQISLEQAQLQLQQAQIIAPFDGVVTALDAKLAQSSGSSTIQVADLDHLEIVVNMAEVDVNQIKVGQPAEITFDAVPDAVVKGEVAVIAPAGVLTQGVVNYPVTVALDNPDTSIKTGMTANLNVIVDQRDNALMVPNRAVRTVGRQKMATVLFEGQDIQVPVQTGLSNDTMTEITSGLKEGDEVVLSTTTTASQGGGFGGGFGGTFGARPIGR